MLDQQLDNGIRIVNIVLGIEPELVEHGIFADKIGDRIFEYRHDFFENGARRFCLEILNNVELDVELFGDTKSIGRAISIRVMEDGCGWFFRHG
jgi:hypothetical protein